MRCGMNENSLWKINIISLFTLGGDQMRFRDALISAYCEDPCRVLPHAIWKTLAGVDQFETSFEVENTVVMRLEMWNEERLHLYWHRNRHLPSIPRDRIGHLELALVHQDYLSAVPVEHFAKRKSYFRLIHRNRALSAVEMPPGFRIINVNVDTDARAVAELIGQCYDTLHPSTEDVQNWTHHPVFDRDSWIWVIDEKKDSPVGLGIAEVDSIIPEASLEYIQVLPEYRGKGLGKGIVLELLSRLCGRVEFTTVSGEAENPTNPEGLYRGCGFCGDEVWWVLRC